MAFSLTSPKFQDHKEIPVEHTREGRNMSPPLDWQDAPPETKSFALVCEDPDAPDPAHPQKTFVHWVVYNLPVSSTGLAEATKSLPAGALEGLNDWQRTGYGGPCPPIGRHRYFHKLYALDTVLPDLKKPNKARLEQAMKGHIVAEAQLIGTYQKGR